jgi:hypothetical protein
LSRKYFWFFAALKNGRTDIFNKGRQPMTKRILYTLQDVKNLLARIHNVEPTLVDVFESSILEVQVEHCGYIAIEDNTFLFQVTK